MRNTDDRSQARAIAMIAAYLEELRAMRPSVRLTASRSTKGAQTVQTILKAARAVFLREGHSGLTMRKVAAEAGLVVGNVSYYFASKHALLEAMLREELADYVDAHIGHFEADRDSPLDILLNVVTFYVSNARLSHTFFCRLWGYAGSDAPARELVRNLYRSIGQLIYYILKAANPRLSDRRVRELMLQIFSLEEGVKLLIGLGPDNDPVFRNAERDVREFTRRLVEAG